MWTMLITIAESSLCLNLCATSNSHLCHLVCGNTTHELEILKSTLRQTTLQLGIVEDLLEDTNAMKQESQEALRLTMKLLSGRNSTILNELSELQRDLVNCTGSRDISLQRLDTSTLEFQDYRAHCNEKLQNFTKDIEICRWRSQVLFMDTAQVICITIVISTGLFLILLMTCGNHDTCQ